VPLTLADQSGAFLGYPGTSQPRRRRAIAYSDSFLVPNKVVLSQYRNQFNSLRASVCFWTGFSLDQTDQRTKNLFELAVKILKAEEVRIVFGINAKIDAGLALLDSRQRLLRTLA
jgi:hypothetical protein